MEVDGESKVEQRPGTSDDGLVGRGKLVRPRDPVDQSIALHPTALLILTLPLHRTPS